MSSGMTTPHVREHGSLLAEVERPVLIWIAEQLPHSANSDHLTILGLALVRRESVRRRWSPRR